jgi:predicted component of viral defense system (DUF524 family)
VIAYHPELHVALAEGVLQFPAAEDVIVGPIWDEHSVVDEWKTYYLKFYSEIPDSFRERSAPFVKRELPEKIFEINFENWVGLTRIGPLGLKVRNLKIGDDQFHGMLDYVADQYADLVFDFGKLPVGHAHHRGGRVGRDIDYVEFLFLRRYLLDRRQDVEAVTRALVANPHRRLCRGVRQTPVEAARRVSPAALVDTMAGGELVRLRPGHALLETALGRILLAHTGRELYPASVPEEYSYHSVDTHENRFVKHVLEDVLERLEALRDVLSGQSTYLNPSLSQDLETLHRRVGACLHDPLWQEVGRMSFLPANSQVLQRREGYRQFFRLHALMQLLTRYDWALLDVSELLETKNVATLFEYWSFFVVRQALDQVLSRLAHPRLVEVRNFAAELRKEVRIVYEGGVSLVFNRSSPRSEGLSGGPVGDDYDWGDSYSHGFAPDIVVVRGEQVLVLDAKYRGFYREDEVGGITSCKEEDINKMHTYHDAIRGVVGAFALYPGEERKYYPAHGESRFWYGVGAIPLHPDTDGGAHESHFQGLVDLLRAFLA